MSSLRQEGAPTRWLPPLAPVCPTPPGSPPSLEARRRVWWSVPPANSAPPIRAGPRSPGGSAPVTIPGRLPRSPSLLSSPSVSASPLSSLSQSLSGPLVSSAMTPPQQPPALTSEPGALGSSAASYSSLGEPGAGGDGGVRSSQGVPWPVCGFAGGASGHEALACSWPGP